MFLGIQQLVWQPEKKFGLCCIRLHWAVFNDKVLAISQESWLQSASVQCATCLVLFGFGLGLVFFFSAFYLSWCQKYLLLISIGTTPPFLKNKQTNKMVVLKEEFKKKYKQEQQKEQKLFSQIYREWNVSRLLSL